MEKDACSRFEVWVGGCDLICRLPLFPALVGGEGREWERGKGERGRRGLRGGERIGGCD